MELGWIIRWTVSYSEPTLYTYDQVIMYIFNFMVINYQKKIKILYQEGDDIGTLNKYYYVC